MSKNSQVMISEGMISENRKAHFNYIIEDTVEAGIQLMGSEVKSLRLKMANISDAFAMPEGNNFLIQNLKIRRYDKANGFESIGEARARQLLLHKGEIKKLIGAYNRKGATIIPLKLYFNSRGLAKVLLGVGFGKNVIDKREDIKKREWQRDKARLMKMKNK